MLGDFTDTSERGFESLIYECDFLYSFWYSSWCIFLAMTPSRKSTKSQPSRPPRRKRGPSCQC